MKFSQLANILEKLEGTTKRLEITAILADLVNNLQEDEVDLGVYLSLGYLQSEFESEKFNIAEKMMKKILASAFDKTAEQIDILFSKSGDLGSVAAGLASKQKGFDVSIKKVYKMLTEIAQVEGAGSQEKKITKTASLLSDANKLSAKYLVRIILGTTRLGFTELTVIEALVAFLNGGEKNKNLKEKVESKYRIHPDIGLIAKKIKQKGIDGIADIQMEVGVPVHAQKAQRLSSPEEIVEKMGEVWGEYKFDGTRVQLHMDRNKKMKVESFEQQDLFGEDTQTIFVKTFTRNLEETTHQYPDLIEGALNQIDADSIILDGEAIGYNKDTGEFLPFQETIQRKRKYGIAQATKDIPLKYMVFDILYLNGKSLVTKPLVERRKLLSEVVKKGNVIVVDENIQTKDSVKLAKYSKEALEKGLEGIMIKKIDSPYEAGARNFSWVKLKKSEEQILSDTVDCVVFGYYHGRGARAHFGIGGFLVGIWDEKSTKFKTITKVGSGLTDEGWQKMKKKADEISTDTKPTNADIDKKYNCDVWVKPEIVVEIAADELSKSTDHSSGYALRFPRMIRYREDKKPTDTTAIDEIKGMYKSQKVGRN